MQQMDASQLSQMQWRIAHWACHKHQMGPCQGSRWCQVKIALFSSDPPYRLAMKLWTMKGAHVLPC